MTIVHWATNVPDRRVHLRVGFRGSNYGRNPGWPSKSQVRVVVFGTENLQGYGGPQYVQQTDPLGGIIAPRIGQYGMTVHCMSSTILVTCAFQPGVCNWP
jgi:hypothetical protein